MTYKIVRFWFKNKPNRIIKRGLTLEQAQAHCQNEKVLVIAPIPLKKLKLRHVDTKHRQERNIRPLYLEAINLRLSLYSK